MKRLGLVLALLGLIWNGCGQKETPAPKKTPAVPTSMPKITSSPEAAPPPGAAPTAAAAPAEVPTYEGKDEAERLTKALHDYYNRSGATAPAITSFEPLVKAGLLKSVPVPPPGKKYVIDLKQSQVRLVNQ